MALQRHLLLRLSWRNIWRNKRRTIITMAAVVFAVALSVFSWCFALGEHEQMINDTLKVNTGHLQVHDKGYWEERTIYKSFTPPEKLTEFLKGDERIDATVKRLNVDALISSGNDTSGILLIGVDRDEELNFSSMKKKIVRGSFLGPHDNKDIWNYLTDPEGKEGIVIGETLARNLDTDLGDVLIVMTQDFYGALSAENFTVTGLFSSGSPEMDRSMAFINLDTQQYFLSMDGRVSGIAILLKSSRDVKGVTRDVRELLNLEEYEVMPWQKLMPELIQFVEFDNAFGYLFFVMILLVVIFGILNTILMSVMERYREFGVMMALGTRPRDIVRLIMTESALIALLGIVIGNILGYAVVFYFTQVPIDFSAYSEAISSFGIDPLVYAKMDFWIFVITDLIIVGSTLLAAVFPAIKASRLKPVEAIRYI